ncbi:ATP-grasp domain-containing protein [Peribacillus tepidiphilus]|jgi:gamma-F420-2:alpha-L-glutamate ligase|uniref:ATP-grasp domain-containing protein n=1 Tax=Peribacillus tepidiphilus TaxID=2652445 RepID=UPI0012913C55|nr:RimK family alpha-L-glutamate ligase [Peribacillus tepidiphilus]
MKTGWIVFNGNVTHSKFTELVDWLSESGKEAGFHMVKVKNNELLATIENGKAVIKGKYEKEKPDFIIFWDKDIRLARHLEKMGFKLFNNALSIERCDDKSHTFYVLADHGISMPKTIHAPLIFKNSSISDHNHLETIMEELGFPMIIKENYGSFGAQVYMIQNKEEMIAKSTELIRLGIPFIYQQYIKSSHGKDIRLHVVGDQVVAAMLRKSEQDFRANVTNGGKMMPYNPTKEQIDLAVKCSQIIGTDFCGVDLLFGPEEEPIVCEINSNAHFKNIYDCTGVDVSKFMMSYIKEKLEEPLHD